MKIIDLAPEFESLYFCCLEDWSDEIKEAGNHKACWYSKMKDKGLRVKLALNDEGVAGGMIQYLPVDLSSIEGKDLYFVLCIWVHGYKKGRGNFQRKGYGTELLKAAEDDVRKLGAKGLVVWGLSLPFFMRASWFKKHGYHVVDKAGIMRLLWKTYTADAVPPRFIKQKKWPVLRPDKVTVSLFVNGWCPAQNMVLERTKRAAHDFGKQVVLKEYSTLSAEIKNEWGLYDAVFIDHKQLRTGPPPRYEKIRKILAKKVGRLRKRLPEIS
jgi:hypothetical protein